MTDYDIVNSPEFIGLIEPSGPGGSKLRLPDWEIKRRWKNPHPNVVDGTIVALDGGRQLVARWHPLSAWIEADTARHFGWLHFVAPIDDRVRSWPVEKLRYPHEADGTSSVNSYDWFYPDGDAYPDAWAVIFDGKFDSPVRNRQRSRPSYLPPPGSLCAFWVGGWEPGGINRRTDLLPWRFEGAAVPPPPPPPGGESISDDEIRRVVRRLSELLR